MNNEDGLRRYMPATDVVKAPEGFSSKVMSRIYMEKKPVKEERSFMVPVVSGLVFLTLVVAAMLLPDYSLNLPDLNFPENFSFSFPELSSGIIIPRNSFYIITGIIFIALFDSGLHKIFRKNKL